jgi:hypothetical protein
MVMLSERLLCPSLRARLPVVTLQRLVVSTHLVAVLTQTIKASVLAEAVQTE